MGEALFFLIWGLMGAVVVLGARGWLTGRARRRRGLL